MDTTDYGVLLSYVEILGDVLTNIPRYVEVEKAVKETEVFDSKLPPPSQGSTSLDKKNAKSELQQIIQVLKELENKIGTC